MGLAALFMPGLLGIVADRWINAERVLGMCHLIGAVLLFWASTVTNPIVMYWVMLFNAMAYMPTIALNSAVSYHILQQKGYDVVKDFPPIRVWGTVGFILAMWIVDLMGWARSLGLREVCVACRARKAGDKLGIRGAHCDRWTRRRLSNGARRHVVPIVRRN